MVVANLAFANGQHARDLQANVETDAQQLSTHITVASALQ